MAGAAGNIVHSNQGGPQALHAQGHACGAVQVSRRAVVAFARDATLSLAHGFDSLQPYRVAYIHGCKLFEAHADRARIVHKVDQAEQMFQMLDAGHVDLALYTRADGVALVRQLQLPAIVPLAPTLQDVDLFLYLHKKHAALVPRLTRALRDMRLDGNHIRLVASPAAA